MTQFFFNDDTVISKSNTDKENEIEDNDNMKDLIHEVISSS